jgi:hypothetical protein
MNNGMFQWVGGRSSKKKIPFSLFAKAVLRLREGKEEEKNLRFPPTIPHLPHHQCHTSRFRQVERAGERPLKPEYV